MVSPIVVHMIYKAIADLDFSHCSSIAGGLKGG